MKQHESFVGCAAHGGCASDYVILALTGIVFFIVCTGICFIMMSRRNIDMKAKNVSLLLVQGVSSVVYISAVVMVRSILQLDRHKFFRSCGLWAIWLEGPAGFGLLLSSYIARTYRLYYVFVVRRLPPMKYYQLLPVILIPWFALATGMHVSKGVNEAPRCGFKTVWEISLAALHVLYSLALLCCTWTIRRISFRFDEFKELSKGLLVCAVILVAWFGIFIAEKIHPKPRLAVASRFVLVFVVDASVLSLFWIPVSEALSEFLRNKETKYKGYGSMGQALGLPHSGLVPAPYTAAFDFNKPLECLLENKLFRQSFIAFADKRMAGEIAHFYDEVRELNKISVSDTVQRIYMVEHIIESYIRVGSCMEINISYQMRSEILNTKDLADLDLFKRAVAEALKMMRENLLQDYWKSSHFKEVKREMEAANDDADGDDDDDGSKEIRVDNPNDPFHHE